MTNDLPAYRHAGDSSPVESTHPCQSGVRIAEESAGFVTRAAPCSARGADDCARVTRAAAQWRIAWHCGG